MIRAHVFVALAYCLIFNPIALRKAKIAYNFGLSKCNRVNRSWKQSFYDYKQNFHVSSSVAFLFFFYYVFYHKNNSTFSLNAVQHYSSLSHAVWQEVKISTNRCVKQS